MTQSATKLITAEVPLGRYLRHLKIEHVEPVIRLGRDLYDGLYRTGVPSRIVAVGSSARLETAENGTPRYHDIDIRALPERQTSMFALQDRVKGLLSQSKYSWGILAKGDLPLADISYGIFDIRVMLNHERQKGRNGNPNGKVVGGYPGLYGGWSNPDEFRLGNPPVDIIFLFDTNDSGAEDILKQHDLTGRSYAALVQ